VIKNCSKKNPTLIFFVLSSSKHAMPRFKAPSSSDGSSSSGCSCSSESEPEASAAAAAVEKKPASPPRRERPKQAAAATAAAAAAGPARPPAATPPKHPPAPPPPSPPPPPASSSHERGMSANEFRDALHARVIRSGMLDDVKVQEGEREKERGRRMRDEGSYENKTAAEGED
jgi:hypothetical protein